MLIVYLYNNDIETINSVYGLISLLYCTSTKMSEIEFFSVESESENSSASDLEEKVVMPK